MTNKTKKSLYAVACAAGAIICATAAENNTINIKGLEDDKDNAVVAAPAELGTKPMTVAISADAIAASGDNGKDVAGIGNSGIISHANVKSLTLDGIVIPPSSEQAKTLEEAIRNILAQAGKQVGCVSSNGIDKLTMDYAQQGDGKSYEVEWRKVLRHLLSPVGYNFTEDGELVLFGLSDEVDVKHKHLAQERLTSNRTPILFTTNDAEGGMELRNAIRDIAIKSGVTITTDYMEQSDLYVPQQTSLGDGTLSASEIGKAKEKSAVQQNQVKRTTFDTNGQQIEWRIVLREILNPYDYDFVEQGGVVRIAKRAKIAQWDKEAISKTPLAAKVIRLYHADPEQVVERVMKIKGLLVHPNASLQATRKKDDNTEVVKNLNARIQTGSGQQSGMSDTSSQLFDKLVRPRTVPAIIAYDVEENIPKIEAKIKLFDIKEKQILIEAIIFQLNTNNGEGDQDGVKWEGFEKFVPLYGSVRNAASIAAAAAAWNEGNPPGTLNGFNLAHGKNAFIKTGGFDFSSVIQLIREQENARLLSSPMLVVGDHSEAAIQVSDVEPIPQVDASSVAGFQAGSAVQNNLNIQWNMLRCGTLLWVSPEITEDGTSVRMTIHPQVVTRGSKVDLGEIDTAGNIFKQYPVYNYQLKMHEMDTRATVPDGATLMFGGLIDNEETEVETKVRGLGDIPVLGWFFRSKEKKIVQKNLIIMIRPTILEEEDQTGFEKNALKEIDDYSANTGRDMRKRPNGPYSVREIRKKVDDIYEERVVKPFEGWNEPLDNKNDGQKNDSVPDEKVSGPGEATVDSKEVAVSEK